MPEGQRDRAIDSARLRWAALAGAKAAVRGTPRRDGIPGFDFPIRYGIWAPAGRPLDVIERLSADIAHALASSELRDWIVKHGAHAMTMTQQEFTRFVESERERAARIVKAGYTALR